MGGGGGRGGSNCTGTAGCGSLGSVRVKTSNVCVTDRPDAQSNLRVEGTNLPAPRCPPLTCPNPVKPAAIPDYPHPPPPWLTAPT